MAFPLAKTLAIKDAADMFGTLFGANLNRRDTLGASMDKVVNIDHDKERIELLINSSETQEDLDLAKTYANEDYLDLIKKKQKEINLKNK